MKTPLRHIVLVTAVLAVLSSASRAVADYASTVLSHNPVGYWRLNETAPSPALNKVINSGTLGSAGDGYIVNDPTLPLTMGSPGVVGNCLRLVNTGNVVGDDRNKVDVPFRQALNPKTFTVEFWAKPNGLGSDATGFSPISSFNPNWYGGGDRSGYLFYLNNNGRWQFRMGLPSGYAVILSAAGGNATVGTWQHIAATFDGSTATIYVNGVNQGSAAVDPRWAPNTQMALRLGGTPLTGNQSTADFISGSSISGNREFEGWLDEVAVYSTVLSASTIAAHHDAVATNNAGYHAQILTSNPVGYYELEDTVASPPSPGSLPIASNIGSVGSAGDATNEWGTLAAQPGPAYAGFGAGNNASFLNGEGGYIAVKDAPGLHFSGQITMMAWIQPGVQDFNRNIISHGWDGNFQETFLRISRSTAADTTGFGDGNYYSVGASDGLSYYDSADSPIPPGDIGNWVFIAGTFDGSNWNLYRNGQLVATYAQTAAPPGGALDVTNAWTIGSRADKTDTADIFALDSYFFGGSIDEPAVFNTALSDSDIAALYTAAQPSPVFTTALVNPGTLFKGDSHSFFIWAEGGGTLTYAWYSNGVPTGVTSTNYTVNNLQVGSKTISVVVTGTYGTPVTNSVTFNVVAAAPAFVQAPQSQTRYTGRAFTFSVTVSGSTPMVLQWKTNGVSVPGANSSIYSDTASLGLNGVVVTCNASNEVTGASGSNSPPATLTVLALPSGYAGAVLADNPLSLYRLGETSGSVAHDYWSGNDGTYFSALLGQPGYSALDSDKAAGFSGSPNSYVGNISPTGINFPGHSTFSVEMWVNGPSGQNDNSTLIAKGIGPTGTTSTEQFGMDVSAGVYHFYTRGNNNVFWDVYAVSGPNGTWQHVVGVYDDSGGSGGTLSIYVNGVLEGSGSGNPNGVRTSSDPVSIGSKRDGNDPAYNDGFAGTLDEVAIYNTALSGSQIQTHYGSAFGPSTSPTITLEPVSATAYVSLASSFSVAAYGTVPLTYVWKKGTTVLSDDGVHILGSATHQLTITNIVSGDAGSYHVEINNSVGPLTSSVPVSLSVLAAPAVKPYIPGLVIHLPLNGDLNDATGRGNNGTGMHVTSVGTNTYSPKASINSGDGTLGFVADGVMGKKALEYSSYAGPFNHETTNDDYYVTLGVRPDLQFGTTTSFTVAFWIRMPPVFPQTLYFTGGDLPFFTDAPTSTFGAPGFVFAPSFGPNANGSSSGVIENSGSWAFSVYDAGGNGVGYYGVAGMLNDGLWHNLVYIIDRKNGSTVYLDGNPAFPRKQAGTTVAATTATLDASPPHEACIGQDPTGTYGESGTMDIQDLGVWRRALTPLEASSIYAAGKVNNLTFAGAFTAVQISATQMQLIWDAGVLQSAPAVTGPYTDVAGPPTSPFTVSTTSGMTYYRIRAPQ